MCGRATLRIVLSSPCMMFASMIEIVIMTRFGTGVTASPLIDRPQNVKPPAGPVALCFNPRSGSGWAYGAIVSCFLAERALAAEKPRLQRSELVDLDAELANPEPKGKTLPG